MKTNILSKMKKTKAQKQEHSQSMSTHEISEDSDPSMPSMLDGPKPELPTGHTQVMDLRSRLQRLNRRSRFSGRLDLRTLATLWAKDYVSQVFPSVQGREEIRLLFSAETSFIAASEITRLGIKEWQKLVNDGRNAKQDFPDL